MVTLAAAPALAKEFTFPDADITIDLLPDGSIGVNERITFVFDGSFTGAYRDVPLRRGESITDVLVFESGTQYQAGASTVLGVIDTPGTYGVEDRGGVVRIVWHYEAFDERRTFDIFYRVTGATTIYDDVVDVNWKVWGDQWDQGVGRVEARLQYEGSPQPGDVLVWGHPLQVDGSTTLGDDGVSPALTAHNVPPRTFVELRVALPRSVLASTDGGQVVSGNGLDDILGKEAANDARFERQQALIGWTLVGLLLLMAAVPAALIGGYLYYGRERRPPGYDRDYEQEPPSDLEPTMVNALINQGRVDEQAFTAVLFDLIRRDLLTAQPVSVDKKTWAGLKTETITDLEIGLGSLGTGLTAPEARVRTILQRVLDEGPLPLSEFRTKVREDASANHTSYLAFQDAAEDAMVRSDLIEEGGTKYPWIVGGVLAVVLVFCWFVVAPWLGGLGTPTNEGMLKVGVIAVAVLGGLLIFAVSRYRKMWVRLSPAGALMAARWQAFRRYLQDFSRIEEAPPISIALWEQFLVYGIALGVAEDVLSAARFAAPEALAATSSLYWYGHQSDYGGYSSNAIEVISSSLTGAFAAPGSSGGGGGAW